MTPPRLHAILARDAAVGVVFRRGPSAQVATYLWDLKTDRFTLGQWLKGRIYWYRADLSPDGRYLIYFAMNGRWGSETGGSWTAISRAPYLKALHLYGWGDCWNGGGLFVDPRRYWLNGAHLATGDRLVDSPEVEAVPIPEGTRIESGECPGLYLPRLRRDGWTETLLERQTSELLATFTKPLPGGGLLEKTFYGAISGGPQGEVYSESHACLTGTGERRPCDGWEWADVSDRDMVYARAGCLWRWAGAETRPRMLKDFGPETFTAQEAPY